MTPVRGPPPRPRASAGRRWRRPRRPEHGRRRHPECGDGRCPPYRSAGTALADDACDAVIGNFVVNPVGQPRSALEELRRVTRPGGRTAVTIWATPAAAGQTLLGRAVLARDEQGLAGRGRPAGHRPPDPAVGPPDDSRGMVERPGRRYRHHRADRVEPVARGRREHQGPLRRAVR
ncbi:class I SAM-dependent methyltransferase [Streptomyces virginiae]|uniref:class I SAM-dependent methyltransferase n=1 Tax=Streptomyces virginiae TaxID=1961 RepID=UPI00365F2F28